MTSQGPPDTGVSAKMFVVRAHCESGGLYLVEQTVSGRWDVYYLNHTEGGLVRGGLLYTQLPRYSLGVILHALEAQVVKMDI